MAATGAATAALAAGPGAATLTTHTFTFELQLLVVNVAANKGPPETEPENESNNPAGQKTVMDPVGKGVASVNVIVAFDAAIDTWVTRPPSSPAGAKSLGRSELDAILIPEK